ncbi:hypothetical protein V2J09_017276 [Rumex salicifolius]
MALASSTNTMKYFITLLGISGFNYIGNYFLWSCKSLSVLFTGGMVYYIIVSSRLLENMFFFLVLYIYVECHMLGSI